MRYELVLFKNNSEEVVSFTINGKETTKVGLNFLDVMTTNFENEAELLRFLKRSGYDTSDVTRVRIRYVYDKKDITLDVCYMEDAMFSKEREKFDYDDPSYKKFTSDFISSLRDGKFVRYLKEAKNEGGNIIYSSLSDVIDDYTYGDRETSPNPIRSNLTNYKQLRDVYFLGK